MDMIIAKRHLGSLGLCLGLLVLPGGEPRPAAQNLAARFRVNVDLVQLNVAVTDRKGSYITGLRPEDFAITEDNNPEKIATFEEGNESVIRFGQKDASEQERGTQGSLGTAGQPGSLRSSAPPVGGASVFILFDTSNYMYRGFVFAQDATIDFVRSMGAADKIALYSFSRNLLRAATLTTDRSRIVAGVRRTVAGDDAALYNCLLLTVEDAAPLRGRKAIVVFSNGPDNASSIPPEDVAELAQSTGTIIYIISTWRATEQPATAAAFRRISKATGGKAYFAGNWHDEQQAFTSIREDLAHLYTLSYYPQPNPNHGWRAIKVKLVGNQLQKYRVRTRDGYSLRKQTQVFADNASEAGLAHGPE